MASYSHAVYCHNGPRLGVYPLQQLEHYRAVRWRACQLKRPEISYRTKARIDPAAILPGPPSLPSRPASAQSRLQLKQDFKTASKKESTHSSPHFIATTASMTIQPRPPQKERLTPPVPKCPPHSSTLAYPYPDPLKIKGDSSFEERLAEIAQHEANTIKQEEWYKSKKQSSLTRPSSARSLNPSKSTKVSSTSRPTSRPTSARGVPSSASTKLRKSSTSNLLSSHLSLAKVQHIHTAIHKSKSAMQLKQPEKQSKVAPSNNKNDTENPPPKVPRAFLPQKTGRESAIENDQKPLISVAKLCVDSLSDSDDSKADNLNVTSDLGLSLDSLHLTSGEESDLPLDTKDSVSSEGISAKAPVSFEIAITPPRKRKRSKNKKTKS